MNQSIIDAAFSVCVYKFRAVNIGLEIIGKRPKPPEKIKMPVSRTALSDVDDVFSGHTAKHDVWKAVVAVQNGVVFKIWSCVVGEFFGFLRCTDMDLV